MYKFIDNCRTLVGWTSSANCSAPAVDSFYHEGRGNQSISYNKTGITSCASIRKEFPLQDFSKYVANGIISFFIYLADLTDVDKVEFRLNQPLAIDGGGSWYWQVGVVSLNIAWNHIEIPMDLPVGQVGDFRLNSVYKVTIGVITNLPGDLLNDIRVNDIELIDRALVVA